MEQIHSFTADQANHLNKNTRRAAGPIRPLCASDYGGAPYVPVSLAATDSLIGEDTIRKRLASKLKRVGKADYIRIGVFNLEFFGEE